MGTEAVLIALDAGEVYELGKFAGTWIDHGDASDMKWDRCDLATFTGRVLDALLGHDRDREYVAEWERDDGPGTAEPSVRRSAAAIFAFLERHDWKVECMSDECLWDRYEKHGRKFRVVGNRYDDGR